MGMNVNNGRIIPPNWKDRINKDTQQEIKQLNAEPLKPGNMNPLPRPNGSTPDIQTILNNLDNPEIPKFS